MDSSASRSENTKDTDNTDKEQAVRLDTAYMMLETIPSVMGFVSSDLRRNSPVDNSVHFQLLRTLRRGRRNLHQLADQQGVRLPTMSRTVSVLENRGWVERVRSEEDRRTVFACITDDGIAVLNEVEDMAVHRAADLLACLPEKELENLRSGLSTLYEIVREHLGTTVEEGTVDGKPPGCKESEE